MIFELSTYNVENNVNYDHDRILIKKDKTSDAIARYQKINDKEWKIMPYGDDKLLYELNLSQHKLLIEKLQILNAYYNVKIEFLVDLVKDKDDLVSAGYNK